MATTRMKHSDEEWLDLITQCRRSGHTDADWCRDHSIPISSFYNAVSRLRKKACTIPETSAGHPERILDLTSSSQDVVPIRIEPEKSSVSGLCSVPEAASMYLDNSHSIEILVGNASVRISNGADLSLLSTVLTSLRGLVC